MSLVPFHRFLITAAIAFCGFFAVYTFLGYRRDGGAGALALAIAFAMATVALAVYLRHLRRFLNLPDRDAGR
jgi:O-antigen/teichoic acid export membrane protein